MKDFPFPSKKIREPNEALKGKFDAVTVRKAEENGHTGGLLAKLHYGIVQFLNDAAAVLHSTISECKDISTRLELCLHLQ
ncbi:hypothetical protein LguiA_000539 [Lonicera macranthoides]